MTKQTKLTAINEINERNVEVMMGKAICAFANARTIFKKSYNDPQFRHVSQDEIVAACEAEYEATVRCLDLLVKENLYEIQQIIRDCAEEMMRA